MKKTLRILLFAALFACLCGLMAFSAAAAGEYQVRNGSDAVVGTYDTLSSAVAAVSGNNFTINVLADVTDTAGVTLNKAYTYTINGNGHTITNNADVRLFSATAGTVTLRNVTLYRGNTTNSLLYISNAAANVTLDGVTLTGGDIQIGMYAAGRLTVQGASSLGGGCGARIMHMGNASRGGRVTLAGGTYVDGPDFGFTGSGAEIVVTGGTFTTSHVSMFEQLDNDYISPIIITGGEFTALNSASIVRVNRTSDQLGTTSDLYTYGDDIVRISGGTFHVNGTGAHAVYTCVTVALDPRADGAVTGHPTIAVSGGTFIAADGAHSILNGTSVTITTGLPYYRVTGGSFSGSLAWIRSSGSEVFEIGTPGNNATPTFYGNASTADARFIRFHNASQNGRMIVYGGSFTVESNNILFNAAGADIDIRGGVFTHTGIGVYMDDGDRVSNVTVSGGTFNNVGTRPTFSFGAPDNVNNAKKGSLEISGGTFNSVNGANIVRYDTGEIGTHCTISGGTFNGGGSNTVLLIRGHNDVRTPLSVTGGKFSEDITRYVLGHGSSGVSITLEDDVTYYTVNAAEITPFCGSQLALGQNLSLYLYFVVPTEVAGQTLSLTITAEGTVTQLDEYETSRAYPDGAPLTAGYTLLKFVYAGIAPQRMGDTITAVLKANGATYATMGEYRVTGYCGKLLSGASGAETKRLVANLLNYGAAAQNYTGYHSAELVNTVEGVGTYATAFETVSASAARFSGPGANGFALTRCGLRFDSVNRLYVRFTAPVLDAVRITYSIGGNVANAIIRDAGDGTYIAYTAGINLTDFAKNVVFSMQDKNAGDGVNVMPVTCTYSVLSFIAAWQGNDGVTGDLAKALGTYYQSAATYLDPFTPVLRFVAISDIHFLTWDDTSTTTTVMPQQESDLQRCATRLASLFTRSYEYAATKSYNTVDAFMIVGDNTDDGTAKQITDFLAIVKENINSEQTKYLMVHGNHEFYDTGESGSGANNHATTDARLTSLLAASGITNYEKIKFHTTVNGYHFIGFSPTDRGGRAFSDEVAEWLDGELAAAVAENTAAGHPNNPIFVCQHQQVCDTVNGCPSAGSTYDQANIRAVLAKYPQVVDFAGHSHSIIDHPNSVWQGEFTALSTGTLAYSSGQTNTRGGSYSSNTHGDPYAEYNERETAEFTIVEIDANNRMRLVYIQLDERDNTTPIQIGERIINVGDRSKFNWGQLKKASWTLPYFSEGLELTRYDVETPTSLQIAIPNATCDAGVSRYRCDLYQNGSLVKSVTRLASQYRKPVPQCVVPFTGLTPATTYTVKVYPVSYTGAIGLPIEGTFTTAPQDDVLTPDIFSARFMASGEVVNAVNGDVLVKNGSASASLGKATFSGEGDYQWRGIEEYYELFQTTLTLETYAKVNSASRGKFIVGNLAYHIPSESPSSTQLHGGYGFKVESDGKLSFYLLTSANTPSWHNISNVTLLKHAVTTETAYDNDTYVHLVGTYDGRDIKFYVNGELVGTINRPGVIDYPRKHTGQYLCIGGDSNLEYNSVDQMTGEIAKVNMYSTVMNASQVATLYARRDEAQLPADWGTLEYIDNADGGFVPVVRFAVSSDIHNRTMGCDGATMLEVDTETRHIANLFRHAYQYADMSVYKDVDAFMVVGDYTDYGRTQQYAAFTNIANAEMQEGTELLVCLGNHEFWETGENGSGTVTTKTYARFEEYFGHAPDSHVVINGFHFIGISPDCNGGRNYSATKAEWLAGELAIAAADDPTGERPIFVYQHVAPANTVYGSSSTTDPSANYAAINTGNVMKNYPQVVLFSGHSHRPTNDPASIAQEDYTVINTGALTYAGYNIYTDSGIAGALKKDDRGGLFLSSMGDAKNEHALRESTIFMIIEADAAGRVRIQYIDVDAHCRVGEPIIIDSIGHKDQFTLTAARAEASEVPYFANDAAIELVSALPNSLRLSFPQAICADMVRNYKVEVYRGDTKVDTFYRLSNVYFLPVPTTLLAPCVGLEPNTSYTVKIYAYNTWGKISTVPLTGTFTTPAAQAEPTPDLFQLAFRADGTAYDALTGKDLVRNGTATTAYEGALGRHVGMFDGSGDYQWWDISQHYEIMAGCFTFEALIWSDGKPASGYYDICSNQQVGGFGFEYVTNGNVLFYIHSESASAWIKPAAALPVGEYVHLVGTCDGVKARIYLNGVLAGEADFNSRIFFPLQPGSQFLSIGADSGTNGVSTNHFRGRVAVTNLYSAALTAEQVAALAAKYPQKVLQVEFNANGTAYNAVTGEKLVTDGTAKTALDEATGRFVGSFDGSGDYQWRGLADVYGELATSMTLETYVKVDEGVESGWVDLISDQHAGGIGFELKAGNQLYFLFYDGSKYDRVGPYTMPVGTYVHLVVTYDGTDCVLYANGEQVAVADECCASIVFPAEPTALFLAIGGDAGADYSGQCHMTGSVAVVNVYAEALTAAQVAMLYDDINN